MSKARPRRAATAALRARAPRRGASRASAAACSRERPARERATLTAASARLPPQSDTPEVTRDDQASINSFGRLNNRLHELDAELEGKKARFARRRLRLCPRWR